MLITYSQIQAQDNIDISPDYVPKQLNNAITQAELFGLMPILGQGLYETMVSNYPTYTGEYATLYTKIVPYLCHQTNVNYIPTAGIISTQSGFMMHNVDYALHLTAENRKAMIKSAENFANLYKSQLIEWLSNSSLSNDSCRSHQENKVVKMAFISPKSASKPKRK